MQLVLLSVTADLKETFKSWDRFYTPQNVDAKETSEQKIYFLTFKLAFWTNKSAILQ